MQFTIEQLQKDKKISFADLRAAATKKGLVIYPITYGRAKALLGLVPMAKYGQSKKARAKAAQSGAPKRGPGRPKTHAPAAVVKRGPGRPPKNASFSTFAPKRGPGRPRKQINPLDTLETLIGAMKAGVQASATYRRALEQVHQIVGAALRG